VAKSVEKAKKTSASTDKPKPVLLVNDGNFLERFKQMQQQNKGKAPSFTSKTDNTFLLLSIYSLNFSHNTWKMLVVLTSQKFCYSLI